MISASSSRLSKRSPFDAKRGSAGRSGRPISAQNCGQRFAPVAPEPQPCAEGLSGRLVELLGPTPVAEDVLIRDLGAPAATVAAALLDLEMGGRVLRHPGGLVSLAV